MKEMMKRVLAFITFEQLVNKSQIESRFQHLRNAQQQQSIPLELIAVRHKLIYEYWYNHVIKHFCFMLLVSTIITHLAISKISIPALAIAGILSYSVMYLFYYRFTFNYRLLPHVEMIKEEFEQKFTAEMKKCRKAQYSNFALVLIEYVNTEISGMASLACDDKSALMLTELYGVDTGSLKKSLEIIFIKNKRKHFTERNKTEYKNRFNEAYDFFEKRECLEGVKILRELEPNFFS